MNYAVMDMFINNIQVLCSWILITAGLLEYPCSLDTFMNSMHANIPEHSYNKMTYTSNSVILYEQLSCIII